MINFGQISGWWLPTPLKNMSRIGMTMMTFKWKNTICSKPPTRICRNSWDIRSFTLEEFVSNGWSSITGMAAEIRYKMNHQELVMISEITVYTRFQTSTPAVGCGYVKNASSSFPQSCHAYNFNIVLYVPNGASHVHLLESFCKTKRVNMTRCCPMLSSSRVESRVALVSYIICICIYIYIHICIYVGVLTFLHSYFYALESISIYPIYRYMHIILK